MRRTLFALAAIALAASPSRPAAADDAAWGQVRTPTPAPAQSIGPINAGCIAGASTLPLDGPGYEVVRVSRNRYYGHPRLTQFVRELGQATQTAGFADLYIGDLGQPRGGPMSFGHGSHQTGLDVDVWFNLKPKPQRPPTERETIEIPLMVTADERAINRANWTPRHVELLRMAARFPVVDRIFVHWTIKRELCQSVTGDRSWLQKIRPWYGHDDHFHVRVTCPPDSPSCVQQAAVPAGDGCDASLDWWFKQREARPPAPPPPPVPAKPRVTKLPQACQAVLTGHSATVQR